MQTTLRGFTDHIAHLAVSPSNGVIAVSTDDENARDYLIRVWRLRDGAAAGILHGHRADINHLAFDPATHLLVSVSDDATLRVWDVECIYESPTGGPSASSGDGVGAPPGGAAAASGDVAEAEVADEPMLAAPPAEGRRSSRAGQARGSVPLAAAVLVPPAASAAVAADASAELLPPQNPLVSMRTPESARCRVYAVRKRGQGRSAQQAPEQSAPKLIRLAVSPAGGVVAVGDNDGTVRLFRIAVPTPATAALTSSAVSIDAAECVRAVGASARGRAAGASVAAVLCIDSDSDPDIGRCLATDDEPPPTLGTDGAVDIGAKPPPDAASGSGPAHRALKDVWTPLASPELIAEFAAHSQEVTTLEFNATGTVLATVAHEEGRAFLWRWSRGKARLAGC